MAPKRATRSNIAPETTNTTSVTNAQLQAMIDQGVTAALAARDADRNTNGDDSHNSGTGVSCTLHSVALTWWNTHVKTVGHDAAYENPSLSLNATEVKRSLRTLKEPQEPITTTTTDTEADTAGLHCMICNQGYEACLYIISYTKIQEYMLKGCPVVLENVNTKETKDKSEKKRLGDVPIVQDFPDVFPEDLSGLPPTRQVEF
ncbi:hypothetical protein Tco_0046421 [Tanacetum coccineum]